jgi:hypothetical protein
MDSSSGQKSLKVVRVARKGDALLSDQFVSRRMSFANVLL